MNATKLDSRFFESTRGRIVLLLRKSSRTVNELAQELALSDNAVRAHLLTLERDGLVESAGSVKGYRKPHVVYRLTPDAGRLFPKSYDSLFNKLLQVLKTRLSPGVFTHVLFDVGRSAGVSRAASPDESLDTRLDRAVETLAEMGGSPRIIREKDRILIKSDSCPLSEVVSEHPEACKVAQSMIEEIIGKAVEENCDREKSPKCCFAVKSDGP